MKKNCLRCSKPFEVSLHYPNQKFCSGKCRSRFNSNRWFKKKCKEDPLWNAEKQKKWREKNPDKFYFLLARSYARKLSPVFKKKLIKEIS